MSRSIRFSCAVLTLLAASTSADAGELPATVSLRAVEEYEAEVAAAEAELKLRVASARKKLLAKLATKPLVTRKSTVDKPRAADDAKTKKGRIKVLAAFYGQNISWLDVSDKVREQVNGKKTWSRKVVTADWGEPAPGFGGPRTLMIQYRIKGKVHMKAVYQGATFSIP